MEFVLSPQIDVAALTAEFQLSGRVRIQPFLEEKCASALRAYLDASDEWRLIVNAGEKVFEIDRAGQRAMPDEARRQLESKIHEAAASGFQYRFESIRVPDEREAREARYSPLDAFAMFLSRTPVIDLLRSITGASDIAFADAQATSFGPGDFLTVHDDNVDGKGRRAAYVFGLTPEWRTDWGGLLMFHSEQGDVEEAWLPRFNTLNIFSVPKPHSVGVVAPFAPKVRCSVTGWLRTKDSAPTTP